MSYTQNKVAMTNYYSELATLTTHIKFTMQPTFDPDEIFELASIQTSYYESAINAAISSCHKVDHQDLSKYDTDSSFALCLDSKVEESKFGATIGSTTTSSKDCCLFIGETITTLTS